MKKRIILYLILFIIIESIIYYFPQIINIKDIFYNYYYKINEELYYSKEIKKITNKKLFNKSVILKTIRVVSNYNNTILLKYFYNEDKLYDIKNDTVLRMGLAIYNLKKENYMELDIFSKYFRKNIKDDIILFSEENMDYFYNNNILVLPIRRVYKGEIGIKELIKLNLLTGKSEIISKAYDEVFIDFSKNILITVLNTGTNTKINFFNSKRLLIENTIEYNLRLEQVKIDKENNIYGKNNNNLVLIKNNYKNEFEKINLLRSVCWYILIDNNNYKIIAMDSDGKYLYFINDKFKISKIEKVYNYKRYIFDKNRNYILLISKDKCKKYLLDLSNNKIKKIILNYNINGEELFLKDINKKIYCYYIDFKDKIIKNILIYK